MKHHTPQPDLKWEQPEPFCLVAERTLDGDRIAAEKKRREADRKESETKQTEFV